MVSRISMEGSIVQGILKKSILSVFLTAVLAGGCAVHNNHLTPEDFARHLVDSGVPVRQAQRLSPDPFRANEALAIDIDGQEIGIYKFNQDTDLQRRRLEKIREEGCTYIIGTKYPVVVHGSFMLLGVEKNPRKKEILKAFKSFE